MTTTAMTTTAADDGGGDHGEDCCGRRLGLGFGFFLFGMLILWGILDFDLGLQLSDFVILGKGVRSNW